MANIRRKLRRTPAETHKEEEDERKHQNYLAMNRVTCDTLTKLVHANAIETTLQERMMKICQESNAIEKSQGNEITRIQHTQETKQQNEETRERTNKEDELRSILKQMLHMLNMFSMSRSTMHLRALTRELDAYETIQLELDQGVQQKHQKVASRQSRRASMAHNHRRMSGYRSSPANSPISLIPETKEHQDDIRHTQEAVQEAIEHLTDLESEGILEATLATRGKALMQDGDQNAILTILKHANDDDTLKTYLLYRRSKTEQDTNTKMKQDLRNQALNDELMERQLLITHLSKGKKNARLILDSLNNITKDTTTATVLPKDMVRSIHQDTLDMYEKIIKEAQTMATDAGISKTNAGAQADASNASMANALYNNAALDLNSKSIKSFVRIRPSAPNSTATTAATTTATTTTGLLQTSATTIQCTTGGTTGGTAATTITVDHVFPENISQSEVFRAVEPMVLCTLVGFNATIFAYGNTGSGKTFTMVGSNDNTNANTNAGDGLIPRACSRIFEECRARMVDGYDHVVRLCYLELYREKLVDLLTKEMSTTTSTVEAQEQEDLNSTVDILESSEGKTMFVYAKDRGNKTTALKDMKGPWVSVSSATEVMRFHRRGCRARAVGRTSLNEHSSRSHSILMLQIVSEGVKGTTCGTLTLVDLAGSENVKQSNVDGESLSEAQSNNKSLAALGNVLSLLAESNKNKNKNKEEMFIPYRSNKLTHILRDTLGGNAHALMITAVRKEPQFLGQTNISLQFAERARSITNAISRNVDTIKSKDAMKRSEKRAHQRNVLSTQIQALMASKLHHQANQPQEQLMIMTDADFGAGHETTGHELLTLGVIYVHLGRLEYAERTLLRCIGIFSLLLEEQQEELPLGSPLDPSHQFCMVQAMHYLALALDVSGDDDKKIYARSLHSAALTKIEHVIQDVKKQKENGAALDDVLGWNIRLGIAFQQHLQRSPKHLTANNNRLAAPTAAASTGATIGVQTSLEYDTSLLTTILHDAVNALNSPLTLDSGLFNAFLLLSPLEEDTRKQSSSVVPSGTARVSAMATLKEMEQMSRIQAEISKCIADGEWKKAYREQIQVVQETHHRHGDCHETTAESIALLGLICESMSKWKDSVSVNVEVLH